MISSISKKNHSVSKLPKNPFEILRQHASKNETFWDIFEHSAFNILWEKSVLDYFFLCQIGSLALLLYDYH